ncbi:DUF4118 domain-containing protein [Oscillibacter sp.]|uniref:sensor histidine kinase n=1 Tax=Oscillibacter sp. TaxID=1945593 RepID=UPI003391C23C
MRSKESILKQLFPFRWRDLLVCVAILLCAASVCMLLQSAATSEGFASPIFVLAVLLISRLTNGYFFGLVASVVGVIAVNYTFTYPYGAINFTLAGYPLTFLTFLMVSVVTSAMTTQVKQQARLRAENEKEKMRANLLRSVSHDIRTPLTSIVGSTSVILENPSISRAEQENLLKDVRDEAQWLIRVVENLLSVTRIGENGQAHITKKDEAAEEILGETVRKFRKRFPDVNITVEAPQELLVVPMDAILIEQVLANLLENAVRHGGTTTYVSLCVERQGGLAKFSVRDNGQGIPKDQLPRLFDGTLKRSETPSGDGKRDMGLGLMVCLTIVRAHNGFMEARNMDSGGAEVFFCLPLTEEEAQ